MRPKLALLHCRAQLLQNVRAPGIIVPALIFPAMFFVFFGMSAATDTFSANLVLASYATYAFLGVVFNQFTGGVVEGRTGTWDEYLRTLPVSYSHRMLGWALSGIVIGLLAFALVVVLALILTDVDAGLSDWLFLSLAVLYGSVTMACFASAVGYWFSPKVAAPVASLIYFGLTYAGAIWTAPESLPGWLQEVSPIIPTRMWAELAWSSIQSAPWQTTHWLGLAGYTVLFGSFAVWGYRRDGHWRRS